MPLPSNAVALSTTAWCAANAVWFGALPPSSGRSRDRFRPRVLEADPASLLDETGDNLDPLLFSMQDARNLIRHGGMHPDRDGLQFDSALSHGLVECLRTLEMLKANGW